MARITEEMIDREIAAFQFGELGRLQAYYRIKQRREIDAMARRRNPFRLNAA